MFGERLLLNHNRGRAFTPYASAHTGWFHCPSHCCAGNGPSEMGAPCRGERAEKYNPIMRVEEELDSAEVYAENGALVRRSIFDQLEYTL